MFAQEKIIVKWIFTQVNFNIKWIYNSSKANGKIEWRKPLNELIFV